MPDQLNIFKQDLTDEEFLVWNEVATRRGRDNAIDAGTVAWRTGINEREVREIVSHLVTSHGKPILSVTSRPPGFFIAETPEEIEVHIRSLRKRGILCLVRAAALSKTSLEAVFNQASFDFHKEREG